MYMHTYIYICIYISTYIYIYIYTRMQRGCFTCDYVCNDVDITCVL